MQLYPLTFHPILKEKVWGGARLEELGKPIPASTSIGESWEVTDLPTSIPGGRSVISNGPYTGRTLRDLLEENSQAILGHAKPADDGGFPLLIKYLDACDNLSVQVHPDDAYAAKHSEAHLKSEAWYVVAAEPDSVIYKGVKQSVTAEEFAQHIENNTVLNDLITVPVKPGDCHYLPSGTCHALGAGVLVAEVQTPSDTTFRVYDWGRTSREIHVQQALECIAFGEDDKSVPPPEVIESGGFTTTLLCQTEFFEMERIEAKPGMSLDVVTNGSPVVWMVLSGSGQIQGAESEQPEFQTGTTLLLPASLNNVAAKFDTDTVFLRISVPVWRGHIA